MSESDSSTGNGKVKILLLGIAGVYAFASLFLLFELHGRISNLPAAVESISGAGPTAVATDAPLYVTLLPSVTEPSPLRLCVPAATVVSHGLG